jgi:hypothetical protein
MIYTKTNASHDLFNERYFKNLSEATFEEHSIYWYDQHDAVIKNTPFNSFIDTPHWEHLQRDSTSKIFMFYGDEYYNLIDVADWVETLKKWKISPQQVYIMCLDKNWVTWTLKRFAEREYDGINIQDYNLLMNKVRLQSQKPNIKRFSMLSRNYNRWRLHLYAELVNKNLLEKVNYTFNNIYPYGETRVFSLEEIKNDLTEIGISFTSHLEQWVSGMPYTLKNTRIQEKLSDRIYNIIQTSGINIVIESHFDPYWNFGEQDDLDPQEFSPSFPTEKIYKSIACRKPFIVFSTPRFLKEFKELGYKTFSPFINESYDEIDNNIDRLNAIVAEIERLTKLSNHEFNCILIKCKEIARHNFKIMKKLKEEVIISDDFGWLYQYLNRPKSSFKKDKKLLNYQEKPQT